MECYSGSYIGFVVVAVLGLISLIGTSLLFNLLYTDLNPCSTIPFAAPRSRLNLFKLALKIIVVIYTVADDKVRMGQRRIEIENMNLVWVKGKKGEVN